jgi:hypothetical protein
MVFDMYCRFCGCPLSGIVDFSNYDDDSTEFQTVDTTWMKIIVKIDDRSGGSGGGSSKSVKLYTYNKEGLLIDNEPYVEHREYDITQNERKYSTYHPAVHYSCWQICGKPTQDYGKIVIPSTWDQGQFLTCLYDESELWMLQDPLINEKNKQRIKLAFEKRQK